MQFAKYQPLLFLSVPVWGKLLIDALVDEPHLPFFSCLIFELVQLWPQPATQRVLLCLFACLGSVESQKQFFWLISKTSVSLFSMQNPGVMIFAFFSSLCPISSRTYFLL